MSVYSTWWTWQAQGKLFVPWINVSIRSRRDNYSNCFMGCQTQNWFWLPHNMFWLGFHKAGTIIQIDWYMLAYISQSCNFLIEKMLMNAKFVQNSSLSNLQINSKVCIFSKGTNKSCISILEMKPWPQYSLNNYWIKVMDSSKGLKSCWSF